MKRHLLSKSSLPKFRIALIFVALLSLVPMFDIFGQDIAQHSIPTESPEESTDLVGVRGRVMSADSIPIEACVVSVLSLPDSTLLATEVTDNKGGFSVKVPKLPLLLHVEQLGFLKMDITVSSAEKPVLITLTPFINELGEVVVKAKRSRLTAKTGMYVFDPSDMYKYFGNAQEMMGFIPLISSFDKKELQIFSKGGGAKIFINGEDPMLSNDIILDKLRAMPPNKIKSVEIIMYPNAMQGQEYTSQGIINIILDDDFKGWNASVSLTANYFNRRFGEDSAGAYWFYQNHNFLFSVCPMYNINDKKYEDNKTLQSENVDVIRNINEKRKRLFHSLNGYLTAEYRFGRSILTGTFGVSSSKSNAEVITKETQTPIAGEASVSVNPLEDTGNNITEKLLSESKEVQPWSVRYYGGVRFNTWFDEAKTAKLNVWASYQGGRPREVSDYMRDLSSETPSPDDVAFFVRNQSYRSQTDNSSAAVSFSKVFADKSVLSANVNYNYNMNHNAYEAPTDRYDFKLRNHFFRVLAEYQREWTNFFSSRIGAAAYLIDRKIEESVQDEYYDDLFKIIQPFAVLTFTFDGGNQSINAGYQRNISMPGDDELNPYKRWISATEYTVGNPNLKPLLGHGFSLDYSLFSQWYLSLNYSFGYSNSYGYRYMDSDGYMVTTTLPNEKDKNFRLNLSWNKSFFSYRWRLSPSFNLKWEESSADLGTSFLKQRSVNYGFSINNNVRILPRYNFSGDLSYRFGGPYKDLNRVTSTSHRLSIGLQKTLWPNADLSLYCTVPIGKTWVKYVSPGMQELKIDRYQQELSLWIYFSWSFGKFTIERVNKV